MKRILLLGIFVLAPTGVCLAQANYTESMTISTYYPSPYGVYRTLTFFPNDSFDPATSPCREGEMSYHKNATTQALYICKGSPPGWKTFGYVSSNNKVKSGHRVSTNRCSGTAHSAGQTCDSEWYRDITFGAPAFNSTSTPDVFVVPERVSDPVNSACTGGRTDFMSVFPDESTIDSSGFRVWASGSPNWQMHACADEGDRSRAEFGWLAIGK
jgi:hypothetical protein